MAHDAEHRHRKQCDCHLRQPRQQHRWTAQFCILRRGKSALWQPVHIECDWKLVDGVPYWCDDPTKYSWTSNDGYIALDTMAMPDEGWATALQQDDRAPNVQITNCWRQF